MNNKEKLESYKRMYSWLEEQANKNKYFDEDGKISDWETLTDLYPELLTLVEDLLSNLESYVKNEEEAQKFLDNIDKVNKANKENYESKYPKIIASVYWWTKEPENEFVGEEDITEKLDEELLESLGLRYGSNLLTTINQIDYISEFIESKIDVEEYDYFFEYHGE